MSFYGREKKTKRKGSHTHYHPFLYVPTLISLYIHFTFHTFPLRPFGPKLGNVSRKRFEPRSGSTRFLHTFSKWFSRQDSFLRFRSKTLPVEFVPRNHSQVHAYEIAAKNLPIRFLDHNHSDGHHRS